MKSITIDETVYDITEISKNGSDQLKNIQFVDEQILQRNNELQVALTAQLGYQRALKRELEKLQGK